MRSTPPTRAGATRPVGARSAPPVPSPPPASAALVRVRPGQPEASTAKQHSRTPVLLRWLRVGLVAVLVAAGVVGGISCQRQSLDITAAIAQTTQVINSEELCISLIEAQGATVIAKLGANPAQTLPQQAEDALADAMARIVADPSTSTDTTSTRSFIEYMNALDRAASQPDAAAARAQLVTAADQLASLLSRYPPERVSPGIFSNSALYGSLAAGLVAAAIMVAASVAVARITHRVFNLGLVVAFCCSLGIAFGPLSFSGELAPARDSSVTMSAIATARHHVAMAKNADLTGALESAYGANAEWHIQEAQRALREVTYPGLNAELFAYAYARGGLTALARAGNWDAALKLAISTAEGPNAAAATFEANAQSRQAEQWSERDADRYQSDLMMMIFLLIVPLTVGGVVGAVLGVRKALGQYR